MNRNSNARFSQVPQVDIQRSRFERPFTHKTTMNAGSLIPFFVDPVLAGDTYSLDTAVLARMTTPIFPTMDNSYMDLYYFYVPARILWTHWKNFMGENTESYWTETTEYNQPHLIPPVGGWDRGSIADYMGLPTNIGGFTADALPFRAYVMCWNEFFRDQNVMQPAYIDFGDADRSGHTRKEDGDGINYQYAFLGGKPLPVCRYHDYFSSCLPAPQKGPSVPLPLFEGDLPITALPMDFYSGTPENNVRLYGLDDLSTSNSYNLSATFGGTDGFRAIADANSGAPSGGPPIGFSNLGVDTSKAAWATINQLRQAFAIQRLYERDSRSGTRYREILRAHFSVTSPDARFQIPEYLGGKRIALNIDQVLQTSATDDVSPQGNTAGYSLTADVSSSFTKSFTEPGYVIGLACIRTDHTYQQGLERFWSRRRRFDHYWPALANIGEQAVLRKEIFVSGNSDLDNQVFGYQEAWSDYRYKPSRVSGAFRSNVDGSLDSWHYADYYAPEGQEETFAFGLNDEWMCETPVNIDRTLAVSSDLEDQFLVDFAVRCTCVRPMPLYSVPGLIDHN